VSCSCSRACAAPRAEPQIELGAGLAVPFINKGLAGTRIGVLVRPAWLPYARGALGVDYITSSGCDNGPRFALDVGLGLVRERSPWRFGGQIDIPVAAGDTGEVNCFFVPTVSHDFDFLATAQHAL
jgi:hypothetical protein